MAQSLQQFVEQLEDADKLHSSGVRKALLAVDRKNFVGENLQSFAYEDRALPIAAGQTISQPSTVVFMLEMLDVKKGQKVLDVGGGGAWVSCLLSSLVGKKGSVFSFEINKEVGEIGKKNLEKQGSCENVKYEIGNAAESWHKHAPYDRIHGAAAFRDIPTELKNMLSVGGTLVAPTQDGNIWVIKRESEDSFSEKAHHGFVFVPFLEG